jgi:hypothetical protein
MRVRRLEDIKNKLDEWEPRMGLDDGDVQWLISRLEIATDALKEAKVALDRQYFNNNGIIENNVAYMAIFNGLNMIYSEGG